MAPPILKLEDIHLTFGGAPLLAGASLQVEPGDRICLVGRNGSGKSTLMKIAASLVEPQGGEVFRRIGADVDHEISLGACRRRLVWWLSALSPVGFSPRM